MTGPGSAPTGFLLHSSAALHDPGWGHPEHQGRLPALASALGADLPLLHRRVEQVEPRFATAEELARVHPPDYLDRLAEASVRAGVDGPVLVGEETPFSSASWDAVRGSAGAGVEAVQRVLDRGWRNAFVASRPPGHHASEARAMGFCAINHVAVAARHFQALVAGGRVAIVDWDVHHGNGTQDIFYDDPTAYFLSLHQAPFYPGTGSREERGVGEGIGTTLNHPLAAGTPRRDYLLAFREALAFAEGEFEPDLILISAGFDALAGDPLGGLLLEPEDFHEMTRRVMDWAERACGGRVVALLEGGYEPRRTAQAALHTVRALAGVDDSPEA
jgi:acetoin utilization deacetylase AcuC-like enzyme